MRLTRRPAVFAWLEDQVRRVDRIFRPKTYFLSHDEIRVANWEQPPRTPAGPALAENVRRSVQIVRGIRPDAKLWVWSDMFDPHHNAVDNYYLVNGTLKGSWEGLPADLGMINWNSGKPKASLPWFADRGHRQILAGYYDGPVTGIRLARPPRSPAPKA